MKVIQNRLTKNIYLSFLFFFCKGNVDKARNAQAIHQQMVQFINNPTYESLPNARHIRDMLERASVIKFSF
jgi:hypothetical protein